MSADRYELRADHTDWLDVRDPQGYRNTINQPGAVALIRQQARDIAELEVFAEIGRQWNTDSSLAKWFPLTAERVEQDAQEIAKLRADLAAAVAERSEYWGALHSTKDELFECRANQRTLESELRITRDQRDTLRADLAAAVAERDEARTAYQVRNTEWHQHELIAIALAERYKLRAEQAEARLAAIEAAPTVAMLCPLTESAFNESTLMTAYQKAKMPHVELIARPAKD